MAKCQLYSICNCRTAVCKTKQPDGTCYYYRYFNNLILSNPLEYNMQLLQNGAINYQTYLTNLLSQIKEH